MDYVKKGLKEMGLGFKENTQIVDYFGQTRQAVLAATKDGKVMPLGWVDEKGTLGLQADWYKVPYSEREFTNKISQLHAKYQVMDVCDDNRWSVDDVQVNNQGEIEVYASNFA
jgi:hypothetical protein